MGWKNRRKSKTYILLTCLHTTSFYVTLFFASNWALSLMVASYIITSYLFIIVGKCPFEIAVQFKREDYLKACRRIYRNNYWIAVVGYGSYVVLWLVCLIDFLIK